MGHWARDCRNKKKDKDKDKGKKKDGNGKAGEQSNVIEEVIAFNVEEELHNFDTFDTTCNIGENDDRLIYYDWLADTATTAHVTHQREAPVTYTPVGDQNVTGVGGPAKIAGRGTIELISMCKGQEYILRLEDVVHVPGTRNNLISLGRWDTKGRRYEGGNGKITLVTKDGRHVAQGEKVSNNLYKMKLSI
jgi:hypothetical protein